jgi:hypothetical protein
MKAPAWTTSTPEQRWVFIVQSLARIRAGQDIIRADLCRVAHDFDEWKAVHQADDDIRGRELAKHRTTLRHFGVCIDELGRDLEALQDFVSPPEVAEDDEQPPALSSRPSILQMFHEDEPKAAAR